MLESLVLVSESILITSFSRMQVNNQFLIVIASTARVNMGSAQGKGKQREQSSNGEADSE